MKHNSWNFGVNLVTYPPPSGLAETCKQLAYAFQAATIPFVVNEFDSGNPSCDGGLGPYFSRDNPFPVNILPSNVVHSHNLVALIPPKYFKNKINIGLWYWELENLSSKLVSRFTPYDEAWVTTKFTEVALAKVCSIPIRKIPFPLRVEAVSQSPRERFGLREGLCVFVFTFDYNSVFERKNPLAVVQAFRAAFDRLDHAVLIINSINSNKDPENSRRLQEAAREARIFIFDGRLRRLDYLNLLAASNCYVSLHRCEGLGVPMAQCMYLGKPVITTAYSGNLEFMNNNNALLVPFDLVQLDRNYGPYEKGNVWAEPDVNEARELMRWVYEHPKESRELGEIASRDVRKQMDPRVVGDQLRSILEKTIRQRK